MTTTRSYEETKGKRFLIGNWMKGSLAPDVSIATSDSQDRYLDRWFIIPRNPLFNIYLHHMLHDDDDRGLHDHPGANVSIVLRGGYDEEMFGYPPSDRRSLLPPTVTKRRKPGRIIFRWARTAHRLTLVDGDSWSLFIVLPKWREWGFWLEQPARWMRWDASNRNS